MYSVGAGVDVVQYTSLQVTATHTCDLYNFKLSGSLQHVQRQSWLIRGWIHNYETV
jgi:hypothetical protein